VETGAVLPLWSGRRRAKVEHRQIAVHLDDVEAVAEALRSRSAAACHSPAWSSSVVSSASSVAISVSHQAIQRSERACTLAITVGR